MTAHRALITSSVGWPVWKGESPDSTWPLRPLRGYVVLPWAIRKQRHLGPMPDMIEYGVLGRRTDTDYWAAGLRITHLLNGVSYVQTLYEGGRDCVGDVSFSRTASFQQVYNRYCAAEENNGYWALAKIAPQ